MNIKDTFLSLTSRTYPYGYEDELTCFLPDGYKMDQDGNYFYEVGKNNKNIFACHLDTACKTYTEVNHVFDGKIIRTDGRTILGADDKAGVTILLYMIYHNVPGLYYFFVGEEVGCIGSTSAAKRTEFFSKYNTIISFDRRGTTSIITHQSSKRTCSDEFADSLSKEFSKFSLNLEKDDGGVYTDSAEFMSVIPECTNISVGYYKEHTFDENQDISFLERLCNACVLINWNGLKISRDPSKIEYKKYTGNYYYYGGDSSYYQRRSSRLDPAYDGFEEEYKRTRRGGNNKRKNNRYGSEYWNKYDLRNNKGRAYYNTIDNEIEKLDGYKFSIDSDYYKGVRSLYLNDSLSLEEFKIVKEQCLNMLDNSDRDFAKYMESTFEFI